MRWCTFSRSIIPCLKVVLVQILLLHLWVYWPPLMPDCEGVVAIYGAYLIHMVNLFYSTSPLPLFYCTPGLAFNFCRERFLWSVYLVLSPNDKLSGASLPKTFPSPSWNKTPPLEWRSSRSPSTNTPSAQDWARCNTNRL